MRITKHEIATLVHDCRAPARHVRQYAKLAEEDAASYNNASLNASLNKIRERVGVLDAMITGLADIALLTCADNHAEDIDFFHLLKTEAEAIGLEVKLEVELNVENENLPLVRFDRNLLTKVFQEIVKNTAQHAPQKTLHAELKSPADETVRLVLSNAVDISYERFPANLTMPFTKPDQKATPGSMGLGLPLARTAMVKGGGELSANYESDQFVVVLQFNG